MNVSKTLSTLVLFLLIVSVALGMLTLYANPGGIQLNAAAADGSRSSLSAFAFGFVFGSTTMSICYIIAIPCVALYRYANKRAMRNTLLQIAAAAFIGITLALVVNYQSIQ